MLTIARRQSKIIVLLTALGLTLIAKPLASQTLPLPEHLVPLISAEGQRLLRDSEALADYVPLTSQFVTQVN
ncbi:phytochelatin synthase family protein [Leptolyngbya sp. FACHB-60]|uniref:phytochelatin synthase family protein n=1 Tax=Cyanophyceae TaxID=3028117 RepID=UPI003220090D